MIGAFNTVQNSMHFSSFFKPQHWPMQVKMVVSIVAAQVGLAVMLVSAVIQRSDAALEMLTHNLQREVDVLLTSTIADALVNKDYSSLQSVLDDSLRGHSIQTIRVLDTNGSLIATTGEVSKLDSIRTIEGITAIDWNTQENVYKKTEIAFRGQVLGIAEYAISLRAQFEGRRKLITQLVIIAVLCTCATVGLACLVGTRLVRRVRHLAYVSNHAMRGNLKSRATVKSLDELGQLGLTFNKMIESINERFESLNTSERLQAAYLNEAKNERARLASVLDSMRAGIVFVDVTGKVIYVNQSANRIWNNQLPTLLLQPGEHHIDERDLPDGRIIFETCHPVYRDSSTAVGSENKVSKILIGSVWVFEDVSQERKNQQTIHNLAERDSLTGLLNRRSFSDALRDQIECANDNSIALVFVDLDNFKLINDLYGHDYGDQTLLDLSQRIRSFTRSSDVVGRIGGDEFVILVKNIQNQEMPSWCDRLLLQLTSTTTKPDEIGKQTTCSVGIAFYPRDAQTAESLIAAADQAKVDAKRVGKNAWRAYQRHTERDTEKMQTLIWADRVNQALRDDGFEIFLQGVHNIVDGSVHHYEALIRMPDQSKPGTFFSPGLFISHAESSGKIIELDHWMIKNCIRLLSQSPECVPMAINISAVSLDDENLPAFVHSQLTEFNVDGHRIHFELTETAALADIERAKKAVKALKTLGCQLCLDDFGSGFASLAYLKHIDADYLKIDGLFIQNMDSDKENQVLLRAIIDIAQQSGRLTVAEWVENEATLDRMRGFGIDLVQGYHLSRPAPASEVLKLTNTVD
jgi:diguanylate cyclase (GGDEF)-like protein